MSYFIYKNNEQSGPFDESFVMGELQNGSFLPHDLACREGMSEWSPLYTFFHLEPQFQSLSQPIRQAVPKCLSCGVVTNWTVESLLLPRHWVVALILLCMFGAGLIYLPLICIIRMNPNSRAKICPACGGRNMWTFQY